MPLNHYGKMMREQVRIHRRLEEHDPMPPEVQKHLDTAAKVWRHLERCESDEQIRVLTACVYEQLHWLPSERRENFMQNLMQGLQAAWTGLQQEVARKGPQLILPPGVTRN